MNKVEGGKFIFNDGKLLVNVNDLLEYTRPKKGDIMVVTGTLVEGIGNAHSDVDIYVICNELPLITDLGPHNGLVLEGDSCVRVALSYLKTNGSFIDIEYYKASEVDDMMRQVDDLFDLSITNTRILRKGLSRATSDALHKFRVGKLLSGESSAELFPPNIWSKLSFIMFRNKVGGYPELKDAMGPWASNDYETSILNLTSYVSEQIYGLCHLAGQTSAKPKWILKNIDRLPEELQSLGMKTKDWLLHDRRTPSLQRELILRGLDIVDEIYNEIARLLDSRSTLAFTKDEALRLTNAEFDREPIKDPQTIAEFEFRRMIYGGPGRRPKQFFLENA